MAKICANTYIEVLSGPNQLALLSSGPRDRACDTYTEIISGPELPELEFARKIQDLLRLKDRC